VYRISEKENNVPRIDLMLIESALMFRKKINRFALRSEQEQKCKALFSMLCLTGFSRADLLESHKKYCNGVKERPTRIEMQEEGENTLSFQNHHKQMKVRHVIYVDFESLVRKITGCERGPEREQKSFTEKLL